MSDVNLEKFVKVGNVSGKLLNEALKRYKKITKEKIVAILKDYDRKIKRKRKVFGYNMDKAVLTAKKGIFYGFVSCHKRALISAENTGKPLVMFIKDNLTFYKFDPEEIRKDVDTRQNLREGIQFTNFAVRLGTKIFK